MKPTLEMPDELFRRATATAAQREIMHFGSRLNLQICYSKCLHYGENALRSYVNGDRSGQVIRS